MKNTFPLSVSESAVDFVYIDLDGVVADFETSMVAQGYSDGKVFKYVAGAYAYLPFMPGAAEAIQTLRASFGCHRIWFLSKPPANAPYVWTEKALWARRHLGEEGLHNLIITMDKSHVGTEKSVLIDDRPHKGGVSRFRGKFIHFNLNWDKALRDLQQHIDPE